MEQLKTLRHINIAALCLVAAVNIIDHISEGRTFGRYVGYVLPFFVVAAIVALWKTYKVNALLYAIFGIAISLTGNTGNFSGVIFLIFSIYIFNTPLTNYVLLSSCALVIIGRYVFMGYTIPDTLNQFVSYAFAFAIYFVLIHPKPQQKPVIARVDDTTIDIVRYLRDGKRPKEIAPLIYMEPSAVYQRLSRARKQFGCGSDPELCKMFDEAGYFGAKADKPAL